MGSGWGSGGLQGRGAGARPGGSVEVSGGLDCSEWVFQTCPKKSKLVVAGAGARVSGMD